MSCRCAQNMQAEGEFALQCGVLSIGTHCRELGIMGEITINDETIGVKYQEALQINKARTYNKSRVLLPTLRWKQLLYFSNIRDFLVEGSSFAEIRLLIFLKGNS